MAAGLTKLKRYRRGANESTTLPFIWREWQNTRKAKRDVIQIQAVPYFRT